MNSSGTVVWSGGFEPFGGEFTVPSAEASGVFLRLPGQWEDPFFDPSTLGVNLHYNLHRWYEPATGRYIAPDPLRLDLEAAFEGAGSLIGHPFTYTDGNPLKRGDPKGRSWEDWIPWVNCIKFFYYLIRCHRDQSSCKEEHGFDGPICQDEEAMAEKFSQLGGRANPVWNECFKKLPSCQKMMEYSVSCSLWGSKRRASLL
jgi:RHS repeat-associated protein